MMRERKNKIIFVHVSLAIALGICAILVFLFSIKGLLLSEAKQHLTELNKNCQDIIEKEITLDSKLAENESDIIELQDNNKENYFDHKVSSYIIDQTGKVLAAFGHQDLSMLLDNNNNLSGYLKGMNELTFWQNLIQNGSQVISYQLQSGENVYAAMDSVNVTDNGMVITIVNKQLIASEINSVYHIAIVIVVLALVALVLAMIYNGYKQRTTVRKLKKSTKPDPVTGLVQYSIHKAMAQKYINAEKYKYAYVSFGIDKYTLISELNGKSYCDYLLKGVAQNVSEWVQEEETFARIQEDIFGILLIYEDELKFRQRLIQILKHASDIPLAENNFCNINFHAGVCVVGKETDIDKIIARAGKARSGKSLHAISNISFYQNKSGKQAERNKIVQEISNAIREDQFLIYLQPKYRMESEEIVGAEALVRWNHPQNGLLSPNIFLPLLEENGMITKIDMQVLIKVCENMRMWMEQGKKAVPVSINLSAKNLSDPGFYNNLIQIVDSNHIPHQLIELEFPESAVYKSQGALIAAMKELSKSEFILSVDNFGVGPAAIQLLKDLPIQVIKIDKGLIKDLDDTEFSDKDRTIVMHIISYAKKNHVEVVAEGVETKGQHDVLLKQQCDIIQGFYYQKPMPVDEFQKLMETVH